MLWSVPAGKSFCPEGGSVVAPGQELNVLRARRQCQTLLELLVLTATPAGTNFLCDRNKLDHQRMSSLSL